MLNRSALVGVLLGVLLLGGMVGFAVGMPKWIDADAHAPLPDDLFPAELMDGRLVISDEVASFENLPAPPEEIVADIQGKGAYGSDRLADFFDADVAADTYIAPDLTAQADVTVINRESGPFVPGLPTDPDAAHDAAWLDVTAYGDVRCFITWGSDDQVVQMRGLPVAVQCQRDADGRTYDIRARGLSAQDTAAALNEVVAHARTVE